MAVAPDSSAKNLRTVFMREGFTNSVVDWNDLDATVHPQGRNP
jgi:hypothetical protein